MRVIFKYKLLMILTLLFIISLIGVLLAGNKIDPNSFRSVHLQNEKQRIALKKEQEKEKKEYIDKIIIDESQFSFKIPGFSSRVSPLQLDRNNDILQDEARTYALKTLINGKKTSTGKIIKYEKPPLSIFSESAYVPGARTGV